MYRTPQTLFLPSTLCRVLLRLSLQVCGAKIGTGSIFVSGVGSGKILNHPSTTYNERKPKFASVNIITAPGICRRSASMCKLMTIRQIGSIVRIVVANCRVCANRCCQVFVNHIVKAVNMNVEDCSEFKCLKTTAERVAFNHGWYAALIYAVAQKPTTNNATVPCCVCGEQVEINRKKYHCQKCFDKFWRQ